MTANVKESIKEMIDSWAGQRRNESREYKDDPRYLISAQALQGLSAYVESLPDGHDILIAIENNLSKHADLSDFSQELNNQLSRYGFNGNFGHEHFMKYISNIL